MDASPQPNTTPFIYLYAHPDIGYALEDHILPAGKLRPTFDNHFYNCLPLTAANTLGWVLHSPYDFCVTWNGGKRREDVVVESNDPRCFVQSWFGHGTFTIAPRFVVQTSPSLNVLVRSVPNHYKAHVLTLDGSVETDWFEGSFTFNFQLQTPNVPVLYRRGDPLALLLPYPRDLIEQVATAVVPPGTRTYYKRMHPYGLWYITRMRQIERGLGKKQIYHHGQTLQGDQVQHHKKTYRLKHFVVRDPYAELQRVDHSID